MRNGRNDFNQNVEKIEEDSRRASDTLVHKLKAMSASEFLRQPAQTFARLSIAQYRDIVASIAPDVVIPQPEEETARSGWLDRFALYLQPQTPVAKSIQASAMAGVTITFATTVLLPLIVWALVPWTMERNISTGNWPACVRLAWDADGCRFETNKALTWHWVAWQTGLPADQLRILNPDLPADYVPARSKITIWRSRGKLVEQRND